MATPLYWKAWELSNLVYDSLLFYRFAIHVNPRTEKFSLEKRKSKRISLILAMLLMTSCILMYLYLIIQAVAFSKTPIKIAKVIQNIFSCGAIALALILALIILSCEHTVAVQHFNTLVDYEKRIMKWSAENQSHGKGKPLSVLIKQELVAFQKNQPVDKNGLLLNVLTIVLLSTGVVLGPVKAIAGTDPVSQMFKEIQSAYTLNILSSQSLRIVLLVVKGVIYTWSTLESTRIYITLCIPTMTICTIYLHILKLINRRSLNITTLLLYHQLYCINQMGMREIANIAGAFMGIGLILLVLGNWVILAGWNVVSNQLYVLTCGIVIISYFVLTSTIPLAISCNEFSWKILAKWKTNVWKQKREIKYWSKKIKAQQPIAFYYACTKFERNTQVNYYSAIIDYTIDALLLF